MELLSKLNGLVVGLGLGVLDVVIFIVVLVGAILLYRRGKKDFVKRLIYALVTQAEKALGSGTGDLKYNLVVTELYNRMPLVLRWLFTKKEIDGFIEDAVTKLKEYLAQGKTLTGYDEEQIRANIEKNVESLKPELGN